MRTVEVARIDAVHATEIRACRVDSVDSTDWTYQPSLLNDWIPYRLRLDSLGKSLIRLANVNNWAKPPLLPTGQATYSKLFLRLSMAMQVSRGEKPAMKNAATIAAIASRGPFGIPPTTLIH